MFMYLDRYAIICTKDTSSSLLLGGWHCWMALVLSRLGFKPSVVNMCPWKMEVEGRLSVFLEVKYDLLMNS